MGANTSAVAWPDDLVDRLATRHRVIVYDHRDTGRSTWAFADRPYAIRDLATDAGTVLDAFGVDRAHAVGMSMGGVIVQLLLLDQPERLRSATVFCTAALGSWRLLNGDELPFDPHVWRRREQRAIDHAGRFENPSAPALADQSGLERGGELTASVVPTLVVEAPADPINPPPHTPHLAANDRERAAGHDPTDGPCPPSRDPRTAGRHDPRPHRHRRRRSGTVTGQPPVCLALVACLRRSPGRIACKAHAGREISIVSSGRCAVDEVLERDGDLAAGVPMPQQYEVGYQPGSCQALGS